MSRVRNALRLTLVGLATGVLAFALIGPLLPFGSPTEVVGAPFAAASSGHPLGTELLGRDVLARVAWGGQALVIEAVAATVAATLLGLAVGTWTGMSASHLAATAVRVMDGISALPGMLLLLLLAAGAPGDDTMMAVAVALVTLPFSVRVIRQQTRAVAASPYAVVARLRGDGRLARLRADILPGIAAVAVADAGIRFVAALQIAATAGFLGLGQGAPAASWGRMVREEIVGFTANPLAALVPAGLVVSVALGVTLALDAAVGRVVDAATPASEPRA